MKYACAIVVATWFAQGCSSQHCTLVGCVNGVDVALRTESGTWADGRYTVSLTTPLRSYACSLQVPIDLPVAPAWTKPLDCTAAAAGEGPAGRFTGNFQRVAACEQPRGVDPKSPECERQADHFIVRARFDEVLPETLAFRVQHDGSAMFEEMRTLRYEAWYPNGPECDRDPCRGTNVEVTMP